jgi:CheY-like chemotaxis protein
MSNKARKILIVDGNDGSRASLRDFFKGLGHEVVEAVTGQEALDKASSLRPDLIMMELRLPEMTGDEATKRLKSNMTTRHIPIVINTGWTTACNIEERVARALNAGRRSVIQTFLPADGTRRSTHLPVRLEHCHFEVSRIP